MLKPVRSPCASARRTEAVKIDIDDGRGVERQDLAHDQAANYGNTQRLAQLRAMNRHRRVAILPFGPKWLKANRTPPWPNDPKTLGEHLRRRRLELGLRQRDAAQELGIRPSSVLSWEKGTRRPADRYIPALIRFLGYDPRPVPVRLGDRLRAWRHHRGLSCKATAKHLGIDEGTLSRWERGIWNPTGPRRKLVEDLLQGSYLCPASLDPAVGKIT